jgi:hypothetical protein
MNLAIVTDAWRPQVNGVVTTLTRTSECLEALGHRVTVLSPEQHRTIPCPTYPEIRLALWPQRKFAAALALDRDSCRREAQSWTWARASAQFLSYLVPTRQTQDLAVPAS